MIYKLNFQNINKIFQKLFKIKLLKKMKILKTN